MKKFIKNILITILVLGIMLVPSLTYAKDSKFVLKKIYDLDENGNLKKIYIHADNALYKNINYEYNGLSVDDAIFDQRYVSTNRNVTQVKDQGNSESCWAYAGTSVLESYLAYKDNKEYNFSPQHIEYLTQREFTDYTNNIAYDREINTGGRINYYLSYYVNNIGPVSQDDVPFTDTYPKTSYKDLTSHEVLVDVNGVNMVDFLEYSPEAVKYIKSQIVKYGAVSVSVHAPESESQLNIINDENGAWYSDVSVSNHDVVLIGWDDNYSASNFKRTPAGNGAWIMLNSWGEEVGDQGYYYISYFDEALYKKFIGSITDVDYEVEDNNYHYIEQMPSHVYGIKEGSASVAIVYDTKTIGEKISEITIAYLNDKSSTSYELFINPDSDDLNNIYNKKVAEGNILLSDHLGLGYYTIKLDKPITITGDRFAVALKYSDNEFPMITNMAFETYSSIGLGKAYISLDNKKWFDLQSESEMNDMGMGDYYDWLMVPPIIVSTNNPVEESDDDSVNSTTPTLEFSDTNGYDRYTYTSILTTNVVTNELAISIVDSAGKDSTSLFEKNIITNGDNYKLVISNTKNALAGKYTVNVSSGDKKSSFEIVIYPDALISEIYGIDQSKFYIYKVSLNTTYSNFKKNFSLYGAKLYNGENLISDDTYKMKTNNLIKASTNTYKVAINGDLNGDGICDGNDTTILVEAIMEVSEIDDIQRLAGDVNGDNKSNAVDILLMRRYIAGLKNSL